MTEQTPPTPEDTISCPRCRSNCDGHGAGFKCRRCGTEFMLTRPERAAVPAPDDAALIEALDRIRDITKPVSMTMAGPRWMSGDTDIFGGGNREKVWRIADAALNGATRVEWREMATAQEEQE